MILSVVLPAYLEAENLKSIIPKIKNVLCEIGEEHEILVIDSERPLDDTREVCDLNGCKYVNRIGGNKYGDAIRTGVEKAQGDYIVIMDADGSHNPQDIIFFYDKMKSDKYDLIIGSRYCNGGETENNFILKFMSWMLNVVYRVMFELHVKDVSDSFRMYLACQLKGISLECDDFDVVEEILIKLYYSKQNYSICEVPISFSKRFAGRSKRDLFRFIKSYLITMKRLMIIKRGITTDAHPLLMQILRFCIVGVTNSVVYYGVYVMSLLLERKFKFIINLDYQIAHVIAFMVSVFWSFNLNRKYVFSDSKDEYFVILAKVYMLYAFTGLIMNPILLFLCHNAGMSEFIAPLIAIVFTTPVNFLLSKLWIFRKKQ